MRKVVTAATAAVALACLGAVALAGEPSTLGVTHLILQVKASPPRAGTVAKPRVVGVEFSSHEFTEDGQRTTLDTKTITFRFAGFRFHPEAFAKCLESKLEKTGPSACPAASRLGAGDALADARPAIANSIPATALAFNGTLDIDPNGKPITPRPAILVYAEATVAGNKVKSYIPTLFAGRDSIITAEGNPPTPGQRPAFNISAVHLKLPAKSTKVRGRTVGFIEAPTSCPGGVWRYTDTHVYYSGQRLVTRDSQPCLK